MTVLLIIVVLAVFVGGVYLSKYIYRRLIETKGDGINTDSKPDA